MSEGPAGRRAVRRPTSRLVKGYGVFGAAVIGIYLLVEVTGWEPARAARGVVPASVRQSPGGYRSFHFWHGGFHGGK